MKAEENQPKISSKSQTFHSALLENPASVRHFTSAASDLSLEYVDVKVNSYSSSTWFCGAFLSKVGCLLSQQRYRALTDVVLLGLVLGDWNRKYQQSVKCCPGHSSIWEQLAECIFMNLQPPQESPRATERLSWSYSSQKCGFEQEFA